MKGTIPFTMGQIEMLPFGTAEHELFAFAGLLPDFYAVERQQRRWLSLSKWDRHFQLCVIL